MPGLLRGIARTAVIAGTATHVSNNVSRRQARKWGAQDQAADQEAAPAQAAAPEAQPAASDTSTQLDDLEKLGQLHEQGILTDAEFEAKKQQILAQ